MVVHLLQMCAEIEDVEHLKREQSAKIQQSLSQGLGNKLSHLTRHMPRREAEVLGGGSIYWIIRGSIRARQRIIGLEAVIGRGGTPRCNLVLDPELIRTEPQSRRPHQGWQYLKPEHAPKDADPRSQDQELPEETVIDVTEIGLI